jgi:hypothetical protein
VSVLGRYVIDYKLVDVPELGYTTKDKPYPRGELRIKTHRMIKAYYKHPEVRHFCHAFLCLALAQSLSTVHGVPC